MHLRIIFYGDIPSRLNRFQVEEFIIGMIVISLVKWVGLLVKSETEKQTVTFNIEQGVNRCSLLLGWSPQSQPVVE